MRHIAIVLLCALVTVSSAWKLKFGFHSHGWMRRPTTLSPQERQNRECVEYRNGRFLCLLLRDRGSFNAGLDAACQCVGEDMKVCVELRAKTEAVSRYYHLLAKPKKKSM